MTVTLKFNLTKRTLHASTCCNGYVGNLIKTKQVLNKLSIRNVFAISQSKVLYHKIPKVHLHSFSESDQNNNRAPVYRPTHFSAAYILGSMFLCFLSVLCKEQGITVIVRNFPYSSKCPTRVISSYIVAFLD